MAPIDVLWSRIIRCSGEVFRQQRGKSFTFSVSGDTVYLDTANQNLSRHQIAEAFARMPLTGPQESDIWAVSTARLVRATPPRSSQSDTPSRFPAGSWSRDVFASSGVRLAVH